MNDLTIIITMAGMGSRFRKAGYDVPKFMIEAKGKTLFEWSMDSLLDYNNHVKKYIFIVQKQDNSASFIKEKCQKYGIAAIDVIEINGLTDGQATTCMHAISHCDPDSPILIYNIDTYVEPYEMKYSDISGDGHIPCFNASGDHWSFVKLNEKGIATEVTEKIRVSDNCSIGAYYFSSAELFERTYKEYYSVEQNLVKGEKYIAPMYNYLIKNGKKVTISMLDQSKVHVLGTPEELEQFQKS
ncbi:MAG: glycosyltransferase family 2 protein [Candidatus Methanomethylophilaceae archaeon]|nr:glycosyltransferase family 2 protein [Candidatus Methanomethylophilaceae archaeon]